MDEMNPVFKVNAKVNQGHPQTCVRFTESEYSRIQKEQRITGKTIPWLLKNSHFSSPMITTTMTVEEKRVFLVELRRIGNNVNQVAKKINSGFREGWSEEFSKACQDLGALRQYVAGIYGSR